MYLLLFAFGQQAWSEDRADLLPQAIREAGVQGGLVVCIGCDEWELVASLRRTPAYTVQGLDAALARVKRARTALRDKGVYGQVSVRHWNGKGLPYVDNLVNGIVVAGGRCQVASEKIARVLAPRGVALIRGPPLKSDTEHLSLQSPAPKGWRVYRKPVPAEIDDWTHFVHGPDNNALAADKAVGPPRHIQWRSEALWGRHHHAEKAGNPTVRTVVSAGGRVFLLSDEIETSNMKVASKWTIAARDAFSGVLLWTTPIGTQGYQKDLPGI